MLLALAGFALLALGDGVIKTMAGEWSPVAIGALRFSLAAAGLGVLLRIGEGPGALRPVRAWAQFGRGAALAMAATMFFTAVMVMPLATAAALGFTTPIFTAILAGPLLGEPVRRETWLASAFALAGVMVVLRPNLGEIGWWAVLPLISALAFSLLIIGNRHVAGLASGLAMQFWAALFAAPLLVAAALLFGASGAPRFMLGWPEWSVVARCALVAVSATGAHWLIYLGTTRAGAASVAPMTYVQLLVASAIGWAWFGDRPDLATLLGAAMIVAAGLYLWSKGQMPEPPESE